MESQGWLSWFLRGLLILGFTVLVGRLIELQVIKGSYYRTLSEENRIRHEVARAPRGKIYARGGEVLTGPEFAHITGYSSEVNQDEVGKTNPECFWRGVKKLGRLTGRGGLNQKYDCTLSGIDGEELFEVDTMGKKVRTLGIRPAIPGEDLHTTIDYSLQKKVSEQMQGKIGAVVATDKLGAILAFYSSPTFDPDNVKDYIDKPDNPFFNRAISGTYHPGSVFKPTVAIAALEQGKIDKNFKYIDNGVIEIKTLYGDFSYSNWYFTQYGRTEGEIDLTKAIARSTDTFFYTIGEMLGPDTIAAYASRLKLDQKTGIDIPGEVGGLIPTPEWKKKVKNENWFLGNTYHMSIGQGDIAVTPLGLNQAVAAIVSGNYCTPYMVGESSCKSVGFDSKNIDLIVKGMKMACATGGTGYTFFDYPEAVACKTGTAEVGLEGATHAWFVLSLDDINLTVLVEKGGEGSRVAGPIARSIMDFVYLTKNP